MRLADIGTKEYPVRASALYGLQACPGFFFWRTIAPMLDLMPAEMVGEPADTGSAVGRGIQLWHESDLDVDAIVGVVEREAMKPDSEMPLANLTKTEHVLRRYVADPRNPRPIVLRGSCELALCAEIGGVWFTGHTDQIREDPINGNLTVWDVKCSKKSAELLKQQYAWQLACYAVLATQHYGRPVQPGGILAVGRYVEGKYSDMDASAVPVLCPVYWDLEQAASWIDHAALYIRELRAGRLHTRPQECCSYCPSALPHCEIDFLPAARSL